MRLFKGQHFFRGGGHGHHHKSGKAGGTYDDSFGSEISTKEQFDILIPIKVPKASRSWGGFLEKDDTTVSSITTTPDLYFPNHTSRMSYLANQQLQHHNAQQNSSSTSWCCCAPMQQPVEAELTPTIPGTENAVVPGDVTNPTLVIDDGVHGATAPPPPLGTFVPTTGPLVAETEPPVLPLARQNAWCCASDQNVHDSTTSLDDRNTLKNGVTNRSICSFNRNNSLFDVLAEEDDVRYGNHHAYGDSSLGAGIGMKKLRNSIRRAIPWGRSRSFKMRRSAGVSNTAAAVAGDSSPAAAVPVAPSSAPLEYYLRVAE